MSIRKPFFDCSKNYAGKGRRIMAIQRRTFLQGLAALFGVGAAEAGGNIFRDYKTTPGNRYMPSPEISTTVRREWFEGKRPEDIPFSISPAMDLILPTFGGAMVSQNQVIIGSEVSKPGILKKVFFYSRDSITNSPAALEIVRRVNFQFLINGSPYEYYSGGGLGGANAPKVVHAPPESPIDLNLSFQAHDIITIVVFCTGVQSQYVNRLVSIYPVVTGYLRG